METKDFQPVTYPSIRKISDKAFDARNKIIGQEAELKHLLGEQEYDEKKYRGKRGLDAILDLDISGFNQARYGRPGEISELRYGLEQARAGEQGEVPLEVSQKYTSDLIRAVINDPIPSEAGVAILRTYVGEQDGKSVFVYPEVKDGKGQKIAYDQRHDFPLVQDRILQQAIVAKVVEYGDTSVMRERAAKYLNGFASNSNPKVYDVGNCVMWLEHKLKCARPFFESVEDFSALVNSVKQYREHHLRRPDVMKYSQYLTQIAVARELAKSSRGTVVEVGYTLLEAVPRAFDNDPQKELIFGSDAEELERIKATLTGISSAF